LEVPLYFTLFCGSLNFGLGTGIASTLEWPPKQLHVASRFVAIEEVVNVQGGLLNVLNSRLAEGRC
jgi:hypothetical protein